MNYLLRVVSMTRTVSTISRLENRVFAKPAQLAPCSKIFEIVQVDHNVLFINLNWVCGKCGGADHADSSCLVQYFFIRFHNNSRRAAKEISSKTFLPLVKDNSNVPPELYKHTFTHQQLSTHTYLAVLQKRLQTIVGYQLRYEK